MSAKTSHVQEDMATRRTWVGVLSEALFQRPVDGERPGRQEDGVIDSIGRSVDDELLLECHSRPLFVRLKN